MSRSVSELRKFVSPEIVFGAGCRHRVGHFASAFGASKVLIVSDAGVQAAGWVTDIEASLQEQGINYHLFTDVSPNPRVEEVMLGAEIYKLPWVYRHCCGGWWQSEWIVRKRLVLLQLMGAVF